MPRPLHNLSIAGFPPTARCRARWPHPPSSLPSLSHKQYSASLPPLHQHPAAPSISCKTPETNAHSYTPCRTLLFLRCHQHKVWLNSSSRIGSAPKSAACINRSCIASASKSAIWSNSIKRIFSLRTESHRRGPYEHIPTKNIRMLNCRSRLLKSRRSLPRNIEVFFQCQTSASDCGFIE